MDMKVDSSYIKRAARASGLEPGAPGRGHGPGAADDSTHREDGGGVIRVRALAGRRFRGRRRKAARSRDARAGGAATQPAVRGRSSARSRRLVAGGAVLVCDAELRRPGADGRQHGHQEIGDESEGVAGRDDSESGKRSSSSTTARSCPTSTTCVSRSSGSRSCRKLQDGRPNPVRDAASSSSRRRRCRSSRPQLIALDGETAEVVVDAGDAAQFEPVDQTASQSAGATSDSARTLAGPLRRPTNLHARPARPVG